VPKPSRVLFFMVVSMFLGYMPWYGLSAVLPHLVREFGLTPGETGSILSAFQLGYVLTVIASGILADRFGNKRVLVGSLGVAGIGFLSDRLGRRKAILLAGSASAAAQFFFGFLYGGSVAGVLGIGSWIGFWCIADSAVYKASLCELVPPARRGTALGIQSAIGYMATVFSPLVFGWIMGLQVAGMSETTRWGLAFFSLGAGALLAPAALFFFPERRLMKKQITCERQAVR